MNEWFKNVIEKIRNFWKSSSVIVKIVVVGIALAVIGAIIFAVNVSGSDSTVRLFPQAVTDESVRNQILDRVAQENVQVYVNDEGVISVNDEKTARRLRTLLTVEGLAPSNYDPFADFYNRSWSTTDAEQNVRHKNALSAALKQHLESLSDIDGIGIAAGNDHDFPAGAQLSCLLQKAQPSDQLGSGVELLILVSPHGSDDAQGLLPAAEPIASDPKVVAVEAFQGKNICLLHTLSSFIPAGGSHGAPPSQRALPYSGPSSGSCP